MKKEFHHKESYKHLYAKQVLNKWLEDATRDKESSEVCTLGQLKWGHELGPIMENEHWNLQCKTMFVTDVDITYCDVNTNMVGFMLFEVVHTNPVSTAKLKRMKQLTGWTQPIFEIEAEWILRQIETPKYLKLKSLSPYFDDNGRYIGPLPKNRVAQLVA